MVFENSTAETATVQESHQNLICKPYFWKSYFLCAKFSPDQEMTKKQR